MRVKITLACTECKQRNYNTMKNKKNSPDRLEMKKYCRFLGRIGKFFRDTVSEMKKVVWPSKKQIINNTVVVAVVVVVAAVLIMVLDAVFGFGLNLLLKGV